jgi:hypothetical protein
MNFSRAFAASPARFAWACACRVSRDSSARVSGEPAASVSRALPAVARGRRGIAGMCRFRVNDTFVLERRWLFVLTDSIIEGQIQAGMIVNMPLNSSQPIAGQIQSIEFARRTDGRKDVCVCIAYESSDELKVWKSLNI